MPLYNYKCSKCEHTFEAIFKVDLRHTPRDQPCPECNAIESVNMKIGCPNIVSGVGDMMSKTPRDFRDKLDLIKKGNLGSNIET